jgi:cytochrome P450
VSGAAAPVVEVDVADMLRDPYPTYARLREHGPVVWAPAVGRHLVVGFDACRAVENDQETYSAHVTGGGATMARALGATPMLRKDDPAHAAERRPVSGVTSARRVLASWGGVFEHNARTCLDVLRDRGPVDADLDGDFAGPLAAQNLVDMLGMTGTTVDDMTRWSHDFIAGIGNLADDPDVWARCDTAQREVDDRLDTLIPELTRTPDSSITSALIHAGLPEENVRANVKLTISGGMNEPQHLITAIVWALHRHPEQRSLALDDPSRWPAAFEETLRWLAPIGMYPRRTTRAATLDGVDLPAEATLGIVVGAANRDAATFERAEDFDITRPPRPHLGFGHGPHLCAGHHAARLAIGRIAVPLLHERLPGLRVDDRREESWHGWVFRGLTRLPVTWDG